MPKFEDLSRSLTAFDQDSTLAAAIEMGSEKWMVGALCPGLKRDPRKTLSQPTAEGLLKLLRRWSDEAAKAGHPIKRICVAYAPCAVTFCGNASPSSIERPIER